ncbi:MAG: Acyl-[acyl-carrier-protein]--UDP-N-acetylglucosamine O-acyltransferase [Flavipsychrobacter sp.]|jgi:UDP-N-acetylglucosamine acyltransferase|nr:Acyl-[acyl-carrier-protein]--UDP-N-acetylglucosamine O-acyltransferase [Flavipsychrobacter sp.]
MNQIHPSSIIGDNVILGDDNQILENVVIKGPTKIGNNNIIGPNVVIGSPGQDTRNPRYDSSNCYIEIGDNNIIREFTAIQKPCYRDITKLGSNIFLMQSVHIPHDAILQDNVVVTPMVVLGGIVHLLKGANIGIGASVHQLSVIGHYTMIGMGNAVVKNVRPFTIYVNGNAPKVNAYALKKYELMDHLDEITRYVTEGILPTSDKILAYAEEFEKLHAESKRPLYM